MTEPTVAAPFKTAEAACFWSMLAAAPRITDEAP